MMRGDGMGNERDRRPQDQEEQTQSNPVVSAIGSLFVVSLSLSLTCAIVYGVPQIRIPWNSPFAPASTAPIVVGPFFSEGGSEQGEENQEEIQEETQGENQGESAEETSPAPDGSGGEAAEEDKTWGTRLYEVVKWWADRYEEWFGWKLN